MAFRTTYSNVENSPESRAESSLEMVIVVNNVRLARIQGLRYSGQTPKREVIEIGTDKVAEFVPGLNRFQGSIQAIAIRYGDLTQRLASAAGGAIDPDSKAAVLSNFPEFDIEVYRRGEPTYPSPTQYAAPTGRQDLVGKGKLVTRLIGCVIENYDSAINAQEALIMQNVSFKFIDEAMSPDKDVSNLSQTTSNFVG